MSVSVVIGGTFPHTNRVFYMTVNCQRIWGPSCHRHGYRHRESPSPWGSLLRVTVVTLMTALYGLILDEGMRRYFVGSLTPST
jgi:hypothetical protein